MSDARNDRRVDRYQHNKADEIRRAILSEHPDRAIEGATEKKIQEYALDVLGSPAFVPWLRTYTVVRGRFIEGWVPDNYFARVIMPTFNCVSEHLGEKSLARQILSSDLFPDLASRVRGCWRDANGVPITQAQAKQKIFADTDTVFLKLENSNKGNGVRKLHVDDFDTMDIPASKNFVIQSWINQHAFFDTWNKSGCATLRLTTCKMPASPAETRASFLRFPGENAEAVIAASSWKVAVDVATGRLTGPLYNPDWKPSDTYGEGGPAINTAEIPQFQNLCRTVEALHDRVPHLTVIGWDVVLDRDENIQIMEWNTRHPDIKFTEATTGPHFSDLIAPL